MRSVSFLVLLSHNCAHSVIYRPILENSIKRTQTVSATDSASNFFHIKCFDLIITELLPQGSRSDLWWEIAEAEPHWIPWWKEAGCQWVSLLDFPIQFLVAQTVKNPPAMQETLVWSLGQKDPLEESMATHSNILTWRIPGTEEPGGLSPWHCKETGMTEQLSTYNPGLLHRLCLCLFHRQQGQAINGNQWKQKPQCSPLQTFESVDSTNKNKSKVCMCLHSLSLSSVPTSQIFEDFNLARAEDWGSNSMCETGHPIS